MIAGQTLEEATAAQTAAEQAAVLRTHYVKVFVSTTPLRQTMGVRGSETDWAPEVSDAFKKAGKVGGFYLVSPKFLLPFDSHRKAAARSREAFGTDYELDGGKVYLVPESRVGEVRESVQKYIDKFEMWKTSDDPDTGVNVLESAEADARASFETYANVLEAKLSSDKFERAFQRWFRPRVELGEDDINSPYRGLLDATGQLRVASGDRLIENERNAFRATPEGITAKNDAVEEARAQVAPMRQRVMAQMVTVDEMAETKIRVKFTELELKEPEGFSPDTKAELLKSRNELAERMSREIPARVAQELGGAFAVALRQENVGNLPETTREKLKKAQGFATDNNFTNDPLIERGIQLAYNLQIGRATRKEVEGLYRALNLQQRMYEQKARLLATNQDAAPQTAPVVEDAPENEQGRTLEA